MPVQMSFARIREIAESHGHVNLSVTERGGGLWRAECNCGWRSGKYALKKIALGAAAHHFELIATAAWWRPKFPGGPTHADALERSLQNRDKTQAGIERAAATRRGENPANVGGGI